MPAGRMSLSQIDAGRADLGRVRLEDVEHDLLVAEADCVELGDGLHHHSQVPQVQSPA